MVQTTTISKAVKQLKAHQTSSQASITILEQSLKQNPNDAINLQIAQYEKKLEAVDSELLTLTTDLINPIQMRHALTDLLKTQKSVSLLSFEVMNPKVITLSSPPEQTVELDEQSTPKQRAHSLQLYRHGIKVTLEGRYFALRDYLQQLEKLDWTFFWQSFDYQLTEYPKGQLTIELYSLSTKKEFVGV